MTQQMIPIDNEYSYVVFLLDESGSMYNIKSDTIGGFNNFIQEQKELKNKIKFSMTLFNSHTIEKRYINIDINDVKELDNSNYSPQGGTPLNDAIGKTMADNSNLSQALFVILTDGEENESTEYTLKTIKKCIEEKQNSGWVFLYLGVDIKDYQDAASSLGIGYAVGRNGYATRDTYSKMSKTVSSYSNSSLDRKITFDASLEFNEDKEEDKKDV